MPSIFHAKNGPNLPDLDDTSKSSRKSICHSSTHPTLVITSLLFSTKSRQSKDKEVLQERNMESTQGVDELIFMGFVFLVEAQQRPNQTNHWHPQVKLIGRGPTGVSTANHWV
jgi:hypothetical protein